MIKIIKYLLMLILLEHKYASANTYASRYNYPDYSTNYVNDVERRAYQIKPIGGYGHPKLAPRLSGEQITLTNPYLVNSNSPDTHTDQSQINCEGVNCQPSSMTNYYDGQQYPLDYAKQQQQTNEIKTPNNADGVNEKIDNSQQQILGYLPPTSSSSVGQHVNHQQSQTGIGSIVYNHENDQANCNSQVWCTDFKTEQVAGAGSDSRPVDIHLILRQQNEYLKALLNNVEQQQLKLLQTILNAQQQYYEIMQRNQEMAILQQSLQPPAQYQTLYYYPTNVDRHYDHNSFYGTDGNSNAADRTKPEYLRMWPSVTSTGSQQYYPNS